MKRERHFHTQVIDKGKVGGHLSVPALAGEYQFRGLNLFHCCGYFISEWLRYVSCAASGRSILRCQAAGSGSCR